MIRLSYQPVRSDLRKVQSFVYYIMLEVILRAPKLKNKRFTLNMVIPRYRQLIEGVNEDYLLKPLEVMYVSCKRLKPYQLRLLRKAVYCNNKIKELCEGRLKPVHYSELSVALGKENDAFIEALRKFCYALYDNCLKRKIFVDSYEDVKNYYRNLVERDSNCVMCGTTDVIDTELEETMSAFDHYLPRALYPFNSVNLDNLVPTCDKCNGKAKKAKDPLYKQKEPPYRQKLQLRCFYPFSCTKYTIVVGVKFDTPFRQKMPKDDIHIALSCAKAQDKVDNWNRIYNIKERYRALVGNDNYYKFYLNEYNNALAWSRTLEQMVKLRENNMEGDMNFLKVPFLKAVIESKKKH